MKHYHLYGDPNSEGEVFQLSQDDPAETPRKPDADKRLLYPRIDGWHDKDRGEVVYRVVEAIPADVDVVGTGANTTETTLANFDIPANQLIAVGRGIDLWAAGTCAANAQVKTIRLKIGGVTIVTNVVTVRPNGVSWTLHARIYRRSLDVQDAFGEGVFGAAHQSVQFTALTLTETAIIPVILTGQNGTATANDIVCRLLAGRLC